MSSKVEAGSAKHCCISCKNFRICGWSKGVLSEYNAALLNNALYPNNWCDPNGVFGQIGEPNGCPYFCFSSNV